MVTPLTPEELKAMEEKVTETVNEISNDANGRRAYKKQRESRKGKEYRISSDIPRDEPVLFYRMHTPRYARRTAHRIASRAARQETVSWQAS